MRKIDKKELKELFYRIKNEDKETATEELYNKYHNVVYGIAFSILKNKEDAEDAMQNVFIKLYNLDTSLVPKSKESTWLYTVAKNEAIEIIRKKKENINLDDIYEIGSDNDLDEIIDEISFNNLISKLNEKEKEIISLKIISNLSFKEIANLLGEPIGTVKWKYYTSIYRIKALFGNLIMCILSFVSGELLFQNKRSSSDIAQMEENTVLDSNTTSDATNKENSREENVQIENSLSEESKNKQDKDIVFGNENVTNEVQTVQNTYHNVNYLKIGTRGLSTIFLIATIITLIFIKKVQPKAKKKTSK